VLLASEAYPVVGVASDFWVFLFKCHSQFSIDFKFEMSKSGAGAKANKSKPKSPKKGANASTNAASSSELPIGESKASTPSSTPQASPRAVDSSGLSQKLQMTQGAGGSAHSYTPGEKSGFCRFINQTFADDPMVAHLLPLDPNSEDLFVKNGDGLLLCKLVKMASADAIDLNHINTKAKLNIFQKTENINAAINAAKRLGVSVVNIGAQDIIDGRLVSTTSRSRRLYSQNCNVIFISDRRWCLG
jgi:hypothetical protein